MFPMGHGKKSGTRLGFIVEDDAKYTPLQVAGNVAYAEVIKVHHTAYYGLLNGIRKVTPKEKRFPRPGDWRSVLKNNEYVSLEDLVRGLTKLSNSPLSRTETNVFFRGEPGGCDWVVTARLVQNFLGWVFCNEPQWIIERVQVDVEIQGRNFWAEVGMRVFIPVRI